ncbi:Asp23/Gls24 family envelope stress response protein [Nucisporomicrobium flavum]|uniref:Asp23/Gls24 family envelope stress response protein n=1 Tax=Nucisporomicrobium flavum TaxID=2785915 RepID=UPI0018F2BC85|nr:Asp23/Gls24 family envelope stress response protein [Nucisporomicrobium flavum]
MTAATEQDQLDANPPPAGEAELGKITIAAHVVEKIAAGAVLEVPDAGGAAPRMFGHAMPGAGHLGIRRTGPGQLPKVKADVDGLTVYLDLAISTRWPASIGRVSRRVREHVRTRVHELTGLNVTGIRIAVTGLISDFTHADLTRTDRARP